MENNTQNFHNFNLDIFAAANKRMIATNDAAYSIRGWGNSSSLERVKDYSDKEISDIIANGRLGDQQKLSRNYFYKDGYYKQIIIHYATLLTYAGLLIPNPGFGKKLSSSHISKRYFAAMDFIERSNLKVILTNFALKALVDGSYYGIYLDNGKKGFGIIDLPSGYARSRFKDIEGNDIVEFDVSYFRTITNKQDRKEALNTYPKIVRQAFARFDNGATSERWIILPADISICFPFFDGRPLFLSVIPATIKYDQAVDQEQQRQAEEVKKILVQKIPHLNDGRLLFEPEEAAEMHTGAVGMLRGNNTNTRVLTTYGDVEMLNAKTSLDDAASTLTRMENNIYAQGGVSGQVFASNGSSTLEASIINDMALMMYLANKFSLFVTRIVNSQFANSNIDFKYQILPISLHNYASYLDESFKLTGSGYSAIIPALAQGISQRDLVNIKELENDVLKLDKKLIPLSSSYTQSGTAAESTGGRPEVEQSKKAEQTLANEKSADKTAGG